MSKKRAAVNAAAMKGLALASRSVPEGKPTVFTARDFLDPLRDRPRSKQNLPRDLVNIMKLCRIATTEHPDGIQNLEATLAEESQPARPDIDAYDLMEARHAYIGTIALAALHAARRRHGDGGWAAIRKHARFFWNDTILHDLVANIGRPTVAAHLLPVFALYEVECLQGAAITSLSVEQMRLLGL